MKRGTHINKHVGPYICTKFGHLSLKNESRNAKIDRLIMRIFDKTEPPSSSSSEILRQWMSLPHFKTIRKKYGCESANGDIQCAKLENATKIR